MQALFDKWIGERTPVFLGTNHRSQDLPFSSWYRFKEAFSPEIVKHAIVDHPTKVKACIDPFSGSGTTALTAQFLGVPSTSYEVNPFLADLGRAKTEYYDIKELRSSFHSVVQSAQTHESTFDHNNEANLPETFVEPGKNGKWLFNADVAHQVFRLRDAISCLNDPTLRRLFEVILGSSLIENSNVVINGKGRRYRKSWQQRPKTKFDLLDTFQTRAERCFVDIESFNSKSAVPARIELQDVRDEDLCFPEFDVSVFSPPYPNSFDYTDVYNVELWMLGYLKNRIQNVELRRQTLTSHVQISKAFARLVDQPALLTETVEKLQIQQDRLWDKRIPRMIETYFLEMSNLLENLAKSKKPKGRVWIVVGNSQYAGVEIETGRILAEIAKGLGYNVVKNDISRKLRTSPQQGGSPRLGEAILVLA
ncbi:DNA methylase [Pelagimonas phthalicica]|uniref:DNA methylase n=1 Tax=Pelagimonas phthalicica TaxID=1037362 RepID=A0A238JDJ1_9RHOB|nr:hypothetical protein [Pelagimonas phthalicica]TDS91170.1 hypothetical protein CLV87_2334 [Pelagimonas phthalicica]SMX28217.1 DNA methylase [Pelagimonas phthalicica]